MKSPLGWILFELLDSSKATNFSVNLVKHQDQLLEQVERFLKKGHGDILIEEDQQALNIMEKIML